MYSKKKGSDTMKHAFLILAHKNFAQLRMLINLLDNHRVDIILHIDKKSPEFHPPKCKYSKLIQIHSMRTNWGAYSLVECELRLLEAALANDTYSYIHLISGQDLPIKPIAEIISFFDTNNYNYVHFDKPEKSITRYQRIRYYSFFQNIKPRERRSLWSLLQRAFIAFQKCIQIDRTKKYSGEFKAGSQWWSIKPELAEYILSNRELIHMLFQFSMCDEMFVQTLVYNSPFFETLYIQEEDDLHANQRLIDFSSGRCKVWTMEDIDIIRNSDLLFARKFDENVDSKIIDEVVKMVTRNDDNNC